MASADPLLSVVVPIHSEEEVIPEFYARTTKALESIAPAIRYELIFVNDGSRDSSLSILMRLAESDPLVKIIDLSRNFGHQMAITAGIDNAGGDAVVMIDGDLQDPPEVIAQMVEKWREGFQVIYGVRKQRKGETAFKLLTAKIFYRTLARMSEIKLPLDSGDFRLLDRIVVDALGQIREESRFIRGLISWVGFKQDALPYERDARFGGETKFSVGRMMRFAIDGITSFSDKPLRFSTQAGMVVTLGSLAYMVWIVIDKLVSPQSSWPGWSSVMAVVLFLGGVQLLSIGILGEYIARVFKETKRRPLYLVANRVNFATRQINSSELKETAVVGTGYLEPHSDD